MSACVCAHAHQFFLIKSPSLACAGVLSQKNLSDSSANLRSCQISPPKPWADNHWTGSCREALRCGIAYTQWYPETLAILPFRRSVALPLALAVGTLRLIKKEARSACCSYQRQQQSLALSMFALVAISGAPMSALFAIPPIQYTHEGWSNQNPSPGPISPLAAPKFC